MKQHLRQGLLTTLVSSLSLVVLACGDDEGDERKHLTPTNTQTTADMSGKGDFPDQDEEDLGEERPDMSPGLDQGEDAGDEGVDLGEMDQGSVDQGPVEGLGWMVARSEVDERPMTAELYGDRGPVLYLLTAIHGNERIAVSYGERVRTLLQGGMAERLGVRIFFVQAGNPDGIDAMSRQNGNGVDLNRNFPADNFDPGAGGGSRPLSESESTLLARTLDWTEPVGVISVHCCGGLFDHDGPGLDLAEAMHVAAQEHAAFRLDRLGSRPGSMGSYVGLTLNLPIITVELDRNDRLPALAQFDAMDAAMDAAAFWTSFQPDDAIDVLDRVELHPDAPRIYKQELLAQTSSSNLPVRLDILGTIASEQTSHRMILSGLNGSRRTGENVAEYLRRQILAEFSPDRLDPFKIVTLANPDILQTLDTTDLDGVDVLAELSSDAPTSSVASALRAQLLMPGLDTVFLIEDHTQDGFKVVGPEATTLTASMRNTASGVRELTAMPDLYATFAEQLAASGKNVVFIGVDTEHYEDQWDDAAPSQSVYWELLFSSL